MPTEVKIPASRALKIKKFLSKRKPILEANLLIRSVAHKRRLKILDFIQSQEDPVKVNEIYHHLDLEQSVASQYLSILRSEEIITSNREGKCILSGVENGVLLKIENAVKKFLYEEYVVKFGTTSKVNLDYNELKQVVLVTRAMTKKVIHKILSFLLETNTDTNVTEIFIKLRMEQSVISQYLSLLRRAGIVKNQRKGQYIFYRIDFDRLEKVLNLIKDLT